jgi:cell division protein ZapA (FtsZ GTPase activity inhibitor)
LKRSVAVTIAGQRFTLKSDADEAYVQGLATLVDQKMRDVQRGAQGKLAAPHAVAVLAALQLADELERERRGRRELRQRVRDKSRAIREFLDREVKA